MQKIHDSGKTDQKDKEDDGQESANAATVVQEAFTLTDILDRAVAEADIGYVVFLQEDLQLTDRLVCDGGDVLQAAAQGETLAQPAESSNSVKFDASETLCTWQPRCGPARRWS